MITATAAALRARETSCVQLARRSLAAIERHDPALNAFLTVLADSALARAAELDSELARGRDRGPLQGIPIAVKDLFCTRGVRTTGGSPLFGDFLPDYDATVVARLEEAGAVLVGKTGLHELAYGITSANPHFGPVRNPWDLDRIPGGSSGGSGAAVTAGMVFMAMGTDTGGSIRIPASFCGCCGLKPTYGRVSKHGVLPLGFSLDHAGPLAGSVRDCALVLNAIAGYDPLDPTTSRRAVEDYAAAGQSLDALRIGRPENFYFDALDPEVERCVTGAFAAAGELGARVSAVQVPDITAMNAVARVILLAEAAAALEPHLDNRAAFGRDVLALLDQGRALPATAYIQAQRLRSGFVRQFAKLWKDVDLIATPTTPITAPRAGEATVVLGGVCEDVRLATTRLVRALNLLGLPALSMPCGFTSSGLPVGLQLIGPPFSERLLVRAGAALESRLGAMKRPPQFDW